MDMKYDFGINGSLRRKQSGEYSEYYLFNAFNSMKAYSYNGERYGYYGYDASGERTYKYGLDRIDITTNQGDVYVTETYWEANEMMLYPNGYLNMNQNGEYTKHYYAGALRIASKIGRGTSGLDLCNDAAIIDNTYPDYLEDRKNMQYEEMKEELTELVPGSQDILDITPIPYPDFCDIGGGGQENELFFYHPDHLGSTGMVTDNNASITQGLFYAPFGDIISDYNTSFHNSPMPNYSFNAKELDEENNMYYYSARYYAPPTFISRDVFFEEKPWMSPYAYCSNQPINRIDPTGMEDNPIFGTDGTFLGVDNRGLEGEAIIMPKEDFRQGMSHEEAMEKGTLRSKLPLVVNPDVLDKIDNQMDQIQLFINKPLACGRADYSPINIEHLILGFKAIGILKDIITVAKFSQSTVDDLVKRLKDQYGGNVTVMKDGKPIFRVHQPGSHGNTHSTITNFRQGVNPNNGQSFSIPEGKVSTFDKRSYDILNQAIKGKGGYSITTKGGR